MSSSIRHPFPAASVTALKLAIFSRHPRSAMGASLTRRKQGS
jgi:hypothetical protein